MDQKYTDLNSELQDCFYQVLSIPAMSASNVDFEGNCIETLKKFIANELTVAELTSQLKELMGRS